MRVLSYLLPHLVPQRQSTYKSESKIIKGIHPVKNSLVNLLLALLTAAFGNILNKKYG